MKKALMIVICIAVAVGGFFVLNKPKQGQEVKQEATAKEDGYETRTIKVSTSGTDQGIDALAAKRFAELIEKATNGKVTVKVYPNCQLAGGSMPKSIELLVAGGSYEMAVFSGSVLGNIDAKFLTHSVPFIFGSYAEASGKMDGAGGEYYQKLCDEKGLVYLNGMHNGLRQLTNSKRNVVLPEDLKGLKIRVPSGEVYMKTLEAFGADPVAMNWSEVFTALQQKTIDGEENGYQTIDSANLYEVQKFMTQWNWSYDGYWFLSNKKDWEKFSPKVQELIRETTKEAALYARKLMEDTEAELKEKFRKNGVTITELTPEQLEPFKVIAKPVQAYFAEKFGEEASTAWGLK